MNREPLNKLVTIGQLKVEAYDEREFRGLVTGARARLSDARDDKLTPPSRFDLAYNAAHGLALAAMRYGGYRPARRFTVFQALEHTLGFAAADWRVLDKCHAMRNRMEYEGESDVDMKLLPELLKVASKLEAEIETLPLPPKE